MSELRVHVQRKHIRFPEAPDAIARIDFGSMEIPFKPTHAALISEESPMGGCGLVMMRSDLVAVGTELRVKVGPLPVLRGTVQWRRDLDDNVMRLGVQFQE
jgi:hypothetical protein